MKRDRIHLGVAVLAVATLTAAVLAGGSYGPDDSSKAAAFAQASAPGDRRGGVAHAPQRGALDAPSTPCDPSATCDAAWVPFFGQAGHPNGPVASAITFDAGDGPKLYVAGSFTAVGGQPAAAIARWDGTSWSSVGGGVDGNVSSLVVFDDGHGGGPSLYAAGLFTHAGGVVVNNIARFDGANWQPLAGPSDVGIDYAVSTLAVFDDGHGPALYAGGGFGHAGGVSVQNLAKWDGTAWSSIGDVNNWVQMLEVFNDGTGPALYVGGHFSVAGGVTALRIAKWNGSTWSAVGGGMNGVVVALKAIDDGVSTALYAGGAFTSAGGVPCNRIARWTGSTWQPLGSGTDDQVYNIEGFDDGGGTGVVACGFFTHAGGIEAHRVARWCGNGWSALGSGMNGAVYDVAVIASPVSPIPSLVAVGSFTDCYDSGDSYIARWTCRNCVGDIDLDGWVDAADLAVLLTAWGASGPANSADLDHSGVVDSSDLGALLGAWGACPLP